MNESFRRSVVSVIGLFIIAGCASSPRFTRDRYEEPKVNSQKSVTSNKKNIYEGIASYYADDFHGKKTANGELFDMNSLTAAHRSFPFGTKVKVTNLENNKSVIVRVNDRGPFQLSRIMDLSKAAAMKLDMVQSGTAKVRLEVLEWGGE
ncbi:MAG: septal ring lytic transglycosylase RlpA family protein [Bacteroidetes bacterium]|nr:septal ring lytic transglycosylase RlpA family protein [Bacteroidota bacterium]